MAGPAYVLLYHRDCGVCSALSPWVRAVDIRRRIRFESLQSGRGPVRGIPQDRMRDARNVPEALFVHQETKRLLPELPLPDIRVPVEFRSEVAHRIVQVERADPTESDGLLDRPKERLVAVPRPEVVARGERMARVDADPETVRMGRAFHDLGELLKPIANDRSRARGVLQDREDIRGVRVFEAPVQARRDRLDGVRLAAPQVGSRLEDPVPDSEDLSAVELLHECVATVVEGVFVRPREVDQIVRVDDCARNPVRGNRLLERLRLLRWNRL